MEENNKIRSVDSGTVGWGDLINNNFALLEERVTRLERQGPTGSNLWAGFLILAMLCGTLLASIWLLTS